MLNIQFLFILFFNLTYRFAAMAASLPSCVECIRIMKDLVRRDPVWSSLSDYTIELLVERSLYSAWRPLNPAASLMRVMEVKCSFLYELVVFLRNSRKLGYKTEFTCLCSMD